MSTFEPLFPTIFDPASMTQSTPEGFVDPGVLYPQLPNAVQSFNRRYAPNNIFQQRLSTPVYNALRNYDMRRVQQGKAPITEEKAAIASTAAQQNRAVTPAPTPNFFQSVGQDLTNLVTSIPQLPGQLIKEAMRLGTLPDELAKIQQTPDAASQLGQYLQLPGINLIPGTYTASNLLTGNADELTSHPLFTALDVLPYASKAAKAAPVYKAATVAEAERAARFSATSGVPESPRTVNPLKTVATRKLSPTGEVVPNKFGELTGAVGQGLANTKLGQLAVDTWAPQSRQLSRIVGGANKKLREDFSPKGPATNDPLSLYARRVNSLGEAHPNITESDRLFITEKLANPLDDAGNPVDIKDMPFNDVQRAYAYELQDLSKQSRFLAQTYSMGDELADREWFGSQEVFTPRQAKKLDALDKKLATATENNNRLSAAKTKLKAFRDRTQAPTITIGGQQLANPYFTPDLDATLDFMKSMQRKDPLAKSVNEAWSRKDYKGVASKLRTMYKRPKWQAALGLTDDQFNAMVDKLDYMQTLQDDAVQYGKYSNRYVKNYTRGVENAKRTVLPARFGEMANAATKAKLRSQMETVYAGDPRLAEFLEMVDNGNYASLIDQSHIDQRWFNDIQKEAAATMADLKLAGADPVWLHRVSPSDAKGMAYPSVLDKRVMPSSLKERTLDISSYIPDLQIGLSHQALEFLNRRIADDIITAIDNTYGQDLIKLREQYVQEANLAKQANPHLDVNQYINNQLKKDGWSIYDPEAYAPWRKQTGSVNEALNKRMVPSAIKRNLDRMHKPPKLVAALDPILNVFRTSVLALSPRWLVNNVFGGAMLLLAETADPVRTIRFLAEARRMVKSGELHAIPGMPERGAFDISPEDIANLTNKLSDADKITALRNHSSGVWMREMWDKVQENKAAGQVKDKFGRVVQASYDLNTWFDDFYRALGYLTGEDKALKKGLSAIEAERAGISTARKIMQNWDEITPIERNILRYIFPFYGFMQHITRYVMRYPIDHPWRTAILGSFARNEMEDMGSGLPQRFLSMAFLGDMDENGNQKAISFGGANPFAAVSDMYTLGGLLGSMNPLISSFAESLGLDPVTGTTSLYPGYTYNHETGRIEAGQSNYLTTLAGNIFPLGGLAANIFNNDEFTRLLKTNPEAAGRMIQAQTGLPILYRNVNQPEEIMKAELARIEAQDKAKSTMLRTGNYDIAQQYPGLNSYLQTIMDQPNLKQYQEPENMQVPNPVQALIASYTGQASLPGPVFNNP